MAFGTKFDRDTAEKQSGDVSTSSIWGFQEGSTVIRLLDDLDDWTMYWEHYDANKKKFLPCTGDRQRCPGCTQDLNSSQRWLANAYVVDTDTKQKPGYVNLYKVPKSLMSKVMRHYDRIGTLQDHDFEVIRDGNGKDTEYDLERQDKADFDFAKYEGSMLDHEEALQAAWDDYVNADVEVTQEEPSRLRAKRDAERPTKRRVRSAEEVEREEDAPSTRRAPAKKGMTDLEAAAAGEDPPTEPQQPESSDEAAEEIITEESIRAMGWDQLFSLAERAGLHVPVTLSEADELSNWLIETLADDE